jgi:peptidoglycan/xylan/chitin deacetylase (PgdA/CDA1 family)
MLKSGHVNVIFGLLAVSLIIFDFLYGMPPAVYLIVLLLYVAIQAYGSSVLAAEFFIPVRSNGPPGSREIALTFDDGPVPGVTDSILQILKDYKTPAAFFCIGNRINENPALVKRMHDAGHLVCNHSYWHRVTFDFQSSSQISAELSQTDGTIRNTIGHRPVFFRPPYGVTNPMVAAAVRRGNYITIGWTIRSLDTGIRNPERLMKRITRRLKGGDIILLHDHGVCTREILPALIEHVTAIGLKIVRIDELLKEKAYA